MGTLFDQPSRPTETVRAAELAAYIAALASICAESGVTMAETIAAAHVLELRRRNDLLVYDGNVRDEQMAGLGTLMSRIVDAIDREA